MRANFYYGSIIMFFVRGCLCCMSVPDAVYLPVPEASCTFPNKTTCSYNLMPDWQPTEGKSVDNQSSVSKVLLTSGQDDRFYLLFRPVNTTNTSITINSTILPAEKYKISFWYATPGTTGVLSLKTIGSSTKDAKQLWNSTNNVQTNWTHEQISVNETDNFTIMFSADEDYDGFVGLDNVEVCRACETLSLIHGKVVYANTIAKFQCDDGYLLDGPSSITCINWKWDTNTPVCKDCGQLLAPEHGSVIAVNTTVGSIATITCDHGHLLVGENTSTCEANGRWNTTQQTCILIDCGHLTVPVHGNISSNESVLGTTVTISCAGGYILNGSSTSRCETTGRWSSTCHMCVPANMSSDSPDIIGRTCESDCSFTNNKTCGYSFGDQWRVWNGDFPFKSRQLPNNADKNSFALFETPFDKETKIHPYASTQQMPAGAACLSFYVQFFNILPGSMGTLYIRSRTVDNETDVIRNITRMGMTNWEAIKGLVVEEADTYYVDFVASSVKYALIGIDDIQLESFYCGVGYKPIISEVHAYCNKSRVELPSCEHIDCGKPIAPSNGTVTHNSTLYGSNATFACNRGYTLNGSMSTTCQRNGRWKQTEQSCIIIDCAKLPSLTDGTITYTMDTTYGSIANLTCNVGFNLTGDPNSVCTINGFWNSTEHSCIPIDCGHPPSIKNGTVYASKTTFASVARFTCEEGYKVNGSNVSVCLSNGVWTNTDQECHIIDCGLLPALKHGTVWYAEHTNITTYKSIASLECNKGYYHEGRNYSECTSSGNWDMYGYQDCVPLDCGPLDTILNAILTSKSTTYGTYSQIQCNEGYIFHGNDTTYCDYDGIWTNYNFNCTIVDCGTITPREYQDISYVGNLTTFKSRAIMVCKSGYVVNVSSGENSEIAACQGDGNWTMSKFSSCVPAVCPWFHLNNSVQTDELVREKLANNTSFYVNASINFNCEAGSTLIGYTSIICLQNGKWSGLPPKCEKENKIYPNCSRKNDTSGSEWPEISPGGIHTRPCSDVNSIGVVFRRCSAKGEWMLPVDGCVRREIETISAQVDAIMLNPTTESIVESLDKLTSVTNWTQTSPDGGHGKIIAKTTSGELQKITNILDTLVNASAAISKVTNTQFEPFLETTSNLLDRQNTDSWKSINQNNEDEKNEVPGALKVLHVVDRYTRVLANSTKHDAITTKTKNIGMYVGPIQKESTDIPLSAKDGVAIKSRVVLQIQPTLPTEKQTSTSVAAVVYRNLSGILSSNMMDSGAEISSEVVAVTLNNSLHDQGLTISLTLGYISESSGQPHCSFWNSTRSGWDGGGCNLTSFNDTSSTCVCNHLQILLFS
ncbi:CUB and sushi domain-containing protein 3-like isoform X1 [Dreissena polymorpha]|uniref:CUB and sushi domain-containing protein 3-like isoform X1 n=2 Tax=Dreissena polymorpha TaxID=45954 RepID=UPI002264ECBF|nr:CUB and sushi domain-containing protein 3-like isoform X1 [Dreissena polymorpha]